MTGSVACEMGWSRLFRGSWNSAKARLNRPTLPASIIWPIAKVAVLREKKLSTEKIDELTENRKRSRELDGTFRRPGTHLLLMSVMALITSDCAMPIATSAQ